MKRLITIISLLVLFTHFGLGAASLTYEGCLPENGSSIDSFEFDLIFDMSETVAEYGESSDYGIFVTGVKSTLLNRSIRLYQGDENTGTLLSTIYNETVNGTNANFKTGNILHLSFPGLNPVEGQKYTICVTTPISVGKLGETQKYSGDIFYHQTPLVLTFIGKESGETEVLGLKSWSIDSKSSIEDLNSVEIEFSKPISVAAGANAALMRQGSSVSSYYEIAIGSISVKDSNPCVAVIDFGEQPAYYEVNYKIVLPEGVVSDANDQNSTIPESSVSFTGSKKLSFSFVEYEPTYDNYGALSTLKLKFDIDQSVASSITSGAVQLYVTDENGDQVCWLTGQPSELPYQIYTVDNKWLSPSTKYNVVVDENTLFGYDDQFYKQPFNICEPFEFSFTTPSFGDVTGIPPVEYMSLGLPEFNLRETAGLEQPYSTKQIDKVEIAFEDYYFEGKKYTDITPKLSGALDSKIGELYEVTEDGDVLIKKFSVTSDKRGTNGLYLYPVLVCNVGETLINGKTYKLVIPENMVRPRGFDYENYVSSPRFEFLFTGEGKAGFTVLDTNIKNGDTIDEVTFAIWKFQGAVAIAENAQARVEAPNNTYVKGRLSAFASGTNTVVRADFTDLTTGKSITTENGHTETFVLPAGAVIYPSDPSIKSPDQRISVNFVPKKEYSDPEFVNTTVTLADNEDNEAHSFVVKTAKNYPVEIQLLPGENWNITDVSHDGKSLTAVNDVYTSEPLTEDSKIVATLKYSKEMDFDEYSGVYTMASTDIRVFTENGHIVIDGLTEPTDIAVYTVGGIRIKSLRSAPDTNKVSISAAANEVYIVVINGQAAKLKL